MCCWAVGSCCVAAILVKYLRGLLSWNNISDSKTVNISLQTESGKPIARRQFDKWLLMRFGFLFVTLR